MNHIPDLATFRDEVSTELPDNWWDVHHKNHQNLLIHFTDEHLQSELDRRIIERRKIEMAKIVKGREAFAYFNGAGGDEIHTEWELHVVFKDASKHCFTFSSNVGQSEETVRAFREMYFPNLVCFHYDDYILYKKSKSKGK
jgi:hypothetical protein